MNPEPLRRAGIAACLVMAASLILFQYVIPPTGVTPVPLFLIFTGLWLFGALMLWRVPWFGGAGTAAWGAISGVAAWVTHETLSPTNVFLIAGSFVTAVIAGAFLAAWLRARRP